MENEDAESSQVEEEDSDLAGQYDYLLGMTMWTLTEEKKDELLKKRDDKLAELKILQAKTPSSLWKEDLEMFSEEVGSMKVIHFLKKLAYPYSCIWEYVISLLLNHSCP
jgi:DNA topoisomerase-2